MITHTKGVPIIPMSMFVIMITSPSARGRRVVVARDRGDVLGRVGHLIYMNICIYIYIYIYMRIHVYMHTCTYTYIYIYIYTHSIYR